MYSQHAFFFYLVCPYPLNALDRLQKQAWYRVHSIFWCAIWNLELLYCSKSFEEEGWVTMQRIYSKVNISCFINVLEDMNTFIHCNMNITAMQNMWWMTLHVDANQRKLKIELTQLELKVKHSLISFLTYIWVEFIKGWKRNVTGQSRMSQTGNLRWKGVTITPWQ